jgi:2'-5' RNA ligase
MMEEIRSFVAIELSDETRDKLGSTQALLKSKGISDQVRWVRPRGIHLTLKFLGDVPIDKVQEIVVAIRQASEGTGPFSLSFGGLGCFPNVRRPNVIWVGIFGDTETLVHLQGRVENRLAVLGFPPEKRKYTPHLTLGRLGRHVSSKERGRLGGMIQTERIDTLAELEVCEISLMKSVLSPAGAQYSRLAVVELEGR